MADTDVIIRDHAGNEHVFPAGFDPTKAADIVKQQNVAAGRSPLGDQPASVPADTFSTGFHEGLKKEPIAGGLVGFGEGLPGGLVKGAWDTITFPITAAKTLVGGTAALLSDPVGTLTKARDTIEGLPAAAKKAFDDAITLASTDPEAWGKAVGDTTGAVEGGVLASRIPVKPGIRLTGKAMQAAGEHPFAARMSGGAMLGRGVLKGDPATAAAGVATMALPKLLTTTGKALREFSGEDLSGAIPSGARNIDIDASKIKGGIRVQPPAGTVRPQPAGGGATGATVSAEATDGLESQVLAGKRPGTPEHAAMLQKLRSQQGSVRTAGGMTSTGPVDAAGRPLGGTTTPVATAAPVSGPQGVPTAATAPAASERAAAATAANPRAVAPKAAKFIGMQDDGLGGQFPLFNVPVEGGGGMTTVSAEKARTMGFSAEVPEGGTKPVVAVTPKAPSIRTQPPAASSGPGASAADIIALRTEHGAEEAGTKLANDPRFRGLSKTERTNAIRDIAGDEAGLLPSGAQRDIDAKLEKMGPQEAKAYLAKAPNATAYNYIAKQMKVLGLLVDEE